MKEETRRAIAYQAAAEINGRNPSSVYSYEKGNHTSMGSGYDYDAQAHFSRSGGGLYHYGTSSHINLNISGTSFSGYDYDEGHHFNGSVNGNSVQIYDYGEGRYFTYSV